MTGTGLVSARRISALGLAACALVVAGAAPAWAAEGSIDHVERQGDRVQVLFSLPGAGDAEPDFETLSVSLADTELNAEAGFAADSEVKVSRTTVLAMDVSNSMRRDNRFAQAQEAARAFIQSAPKDLQIGIVTFANEVTVALPPSPDREAATAVIDGLELSQQTRLHEGLIQAVEASGGEGARSVLLLSDGRDTTDTPVEDVVAAIEEGDVRVDVIALDVPARDTAVLEQFASAGNGTTVSADPDSLTSLFTAEAETLARQVVVSFDAPGPGASEGTLSVAIDAGGEQYVDSAFVNVSAENSEQPAAQPRTELSPVQPTGFRVSRDLMVAGIVGAGLAVLVLMLAAFGVLSGGRKDSVEDRISAYTRKGSRKLAQAKQPQAQGVTAQAVGIAEKALSGNAGLASRLADKLEAAGLALKPAEWLLAHAGIAFFGGLLGLLLSSGNVLIMALGLVLGTILPWIYLSIKRSRRVKAFKAGLADTLQLMAGSLSAGLSLAQSVDTVVREGNDPIASEFRRAI
ncbi:MAG TPA: VWA domain-containing protein, partial [Nocardioidaceae bacterium]|nr:VWA domain-containing protein [Nocardioidaceae bacterium]